ncbi:MAG: carbohydrate-binding protein, partial [Chitinophagaceae bacterium]
ASAATTTVSGLEPGVHTFRLTVTDNGGGTATSDVRVLVQPATTRIQAENHTAMLGVQNEATEDEGGGVHVGFIHRGDWMEYSVTVPTAGNYKFRFRLASFVSGAMFDVRTTSGSILDTIEVFDTGAWQNFLTKTVTLPLVSGTQTLRFQSIAEGGYNFNWFEFESSIANAVLPVNFTLFNANCVNGAVNLLWKTTGSVNSQNFAIEKSRDGTTWTALASVPFDNQNATEQTFRYKDGTAGENAFYRVVEIARDGRRSLSTIIKSNCNTKQNFSVYPNPVADNAYVNITLTSGSRVQVAIIDNKGAVVHQQNSVLPSGSNQLTINVNRLPKGVYTLRATWDNEKRNIQLIKK